MEATTPPTPFDQQPAQLMSRVNTSSKVAPPAPAAQPPELMEPPAPALSASEEPLFSEGSPTNSLSEIHTKNIVVDACGVTATELSLGKTIKMSEDLCSVFGVSPDQPNIIVTGISLANVYSDVPQRVQLSASLFDDAELQHEHLKNDQGWLYAATSSDIEVADHSPISNGEFTNLVSILPFEQQRHSSCSVYTPASSSLNSRMLQEYGGVQSKAQLMEGIVKVTPTTSYVPSSSILCKVISRNWDRFGFHVSF